MSPIDLDPEKQIRDVRHHQSSQMEDPNKCLTTKTSIFATTVEFSVKFHKAWETYEIYKCLGCGGTGTVYEARRTSISVSDGSSQRSLAMKFLSLDKEIDVLRQIPTACYDMKNIVRYRAYIGKTNVFGTKDRWGVVFMDLARNGCLIDWLLRPHRSNRLRFPEHIARRIMLDLISSLGTLRKNGVCHRDVKCENIFIDSQGRFLLGDFGHVHVGRGKNKNHPDFMRMKPPKGEKVGTKDYNPPELLNLRLGANYDSEKVDVFQLGYTLLCLLTNQDLFKLGKGKDGNGKHIVFSREMFDPNNDVQFWTKWDHVRKHPMFIAINMKQEGYRISAPCRKLLSAMLHPNPDERPTFEQLLSARKCNVDDSTNRLAWLSLGNDICSLHELYHELHDRIGGGDIDAFVNTEQKWIKVLRTLSAARAFKASGNRRRRRRSMADHGNYEDDNDNDDDSDEIRGKKIRRTSNYDSGTSASYDRSSNDSSKRVDDVVVIENRDTEAERSLFAASALECWGNTPVRPSMTWDIFLRDNSIEATQKLLDNLEKSLFDEFTGLKISKEESRLPEYWNMCCVCKNENYSFNATLMQDDYHDKEETSQCEGGKSDLNALVLHVRRNHGNALQIQSKLNQIFHSEQLSDLWGESCPIYRSISRQSSIKSSDEGRDISRSVSNASDSVVEVANKGWTVLKKLFGFGS